MSSEENEPQRWWQRIEWSDVLLVVIAVAVLLVLTAEAWLPHYPFGPEP
jgi:uncharacterized membrane protein YeiB